MRKAIETELIIKTAQLRVEWYREALAKGKKDTAAMYLADVTMCESILALAIEARTDSSDWNDAWLQNHKKVWGIA